MVSIRASCKVNASLEKVWDIVSDVDNDPQYWKGVSSIRNIRKEGNVVERVVKVGFMGNEGSQIIKLKPKQSMELTMTKGPLKGTRVMKLTPENHGIRLEVQWDFQFSGIPTFARGFVKSQIERATKEALERIANAAEGLPSRKIVLTSK